MQKSRFLVYYVSIPEHMMSHQEYGLSLKMILTQSYYLNNIICKVPITYGYYLSFNTIGFVI